MSCEGLVEKVLRSTVYTNGKAAQRSFKDQVAWLHLRSCLVLSWCGASRTIWDYCWSWGISGPPGLLPPRLSPKEKRARKWVNEWVCRPTNEYAGLHWNFLFMKLSLVCLPKVNVVFKYLSIFGRKLAFLWKSSRAYQTNQASE